MVQGRREIHTHTHTEGRVFRAFPSQEVALSRVGAESFRRTVG